MLALSNLPSHFDRSLSADLCVSFDHLDGLITEYRLGVFGAEFFAGFGGEEVAKTVGAPGGDIGQFAASLNCAVVGLCGVVIVESTVRFGRRAFLICSTWLAFGGVGLRTLSEGLTRVEKVGVDGSIGQERTDRVLGLLAEGYDAVVATVLVLVGGGAV